MRHRHLIESKRWRSALILLGCYLGVLIIGCLDLRTGYEFSFSIFYLIPLMLAVWQGKMWAALVLSFFSAMLIGVTEIFSGQVYFNTLAPVWNMLMHLGFFLLVVVLGQEYRKELELQRDLARTDPLTGLANIRSFVERGTIEVGRAARFKRPISLAYVDVDDFKKVNDTFGHVRGDALLSCLAKIVSKRVRSYDLVARIGGDEFVVLLPETPAVHARTIGKKIYEAMSECGPKCGITITFSIGVATFTVPPPSIHDLIKAADHLMYKAKARGKNALECQVFGA